MSGSTSNSRVLQWIVTIVVLVFLASLLFPGVGGGPISRRSSCKNNLRQISLALLNYHDEFSCFPPAGIADKTGRPLHSWRVLILPYLDRADLYNAYRFDEPWDGPNNIRLGRYIPSVYKCPSETDVQNPDDPCTSYVAVVGPRSMWPEKETVRLADAADGSSRTLHVAEVRESGIHWMEPRDLHVVQMSQAINAASGQGISSRHKEGANSMFVDGSVHWLPDNVATDTLRQLIDRDDDLPDRNIP
jgi:prepilin-type processing-associated H-X9-DG protein